MSVSTDGIVFYGYIWEDESEIPEEAEELYGKDDPVLVGHHGSDGWRVPYPPSDGVLMFHEFIARAEGEASLAVSEATSGDHLGRAATHVGLAQVYATLALAAATRELKPYTPRGPR